jgi:large subunit ribosomal protein L17
MHRHSYQGRKFGRERDQRRALIKSLADSLVKNESIETTLPKAKEISSYVEKLITKAKKGDLHSRRQIISSLATKEAAHKLVDEIAPKLTERNSGHLRIERGDLRRGDGAQMAKISFVDDLSTKSVKAEKPAKKTETKPKKQETVAKKPAARRTAVEKAEDK